jgi:hypothetical protein
MANAYFCEQFLNLTDHEKKLSILGFVSVVAHSLQPTAGRQLAETD